MSNIPKMTIKNLVKEERPREKMVLKGAKYLSNAELLAILLRTGTKDMSALELANYIINKEKEGIKSLASITVEEMSQIKGIGTAKACQIIAALELGRRVAKSCKMDKFKITSPEGIANIYMEDFRYLKKEIFKILLLNTKNEIINDVEISVGSLNSSIVHPREVFIEAIKRSSNKIILVHNHPSGNPEPSKEDILITNRLVEGGKILGIEVIDHIIFGDGIYFSFKEKTLM
ncbi:DNA repair protein RadC [Alkalithermobacter thermoalcaliphilus JW-YL-7 = DSM 7308]|uniref:DNA repair protein RadC n=2 Tax=Clostridium paradoxum TaxID=29346 RepID=A0A150FRB6_CLOPD|nr:DNA repair protein RadC [[Clostridium] paradoxum JW-YL-7 = DSM 7308]SHK44405.1 DNA repair protein RadC [[Clostridium] paradoxum JW-YL-7 = DSM 7308]